LTVGLKYIDYLSFVCENKDIIDGNGLWISLVNNHVYFIIGDDYIDGEHRCLESEDKHVFSGKVSSIGNNISHASTLISRFRSRFEDENLSYGISSMEYYL